jgi:hypothetical protein
MRQTSLDQVSAQGWLDFSRLVGLIPFLKQGIRMQGKTCPQAGF